MWSATVGCPLPSSPPPALQEDRMRKIRSACIKANALTTSRFFADLAAAARTLPADALALQRRRKQRTDSVATWHMRQKQRATRQERLRVQALRAGDQEAYLRLVEESKNDRLRTLLEKTDELLQALGAMVQLQKDLGEEGGGGTAGGTPSKDRGGERGGKGKKAGRGGAQLAAQLEEAAEGREGEGEGEGRGRVDADIGDEDTIVATGSQGEKAGAAAGGGAKEKERGKRDLMEGQRTYDAAVHSIQEKVTSQPSLLTSGRQLREYQVEGLQWMVSLYNNNLNGILADEMGLGKTIQTIAFVAFLMESKGDPGPHLVLAPKAVLPNWAAEFAAWFPR